MKKYWPVSIPIFLIIMLLLIFSSRAHSQSPSCFLDSSNKMNEDAVRMLGKFYVLAHPMSDPNLLMAFMRDYRACFEEDGMMVRSVQELGKWLTQHKQEDLSPRMIRKNKRRLRRSGIDPCEAEKLIAIVSGIRLQSP